MKVYLSDYQLKLTSVPCTYCSVPAGNNCLDERSGKETTPHHARSIIYERGNK